jgi:hypothetical protein
MENEEVICCQATTQAQRTKSSMTLTGPMDVPKDKNGQYPLVLKLRYSTACNCLNINMLH